MNFFAGKKRTRTVDRQHYNQITLIICLSIVLALGIILIARYGIAIKAQNETAAKLAVAVEKEALFFQQTYYDGVTVEGIAIGGKTKEEARTILTAQLKDKLATPEVKITYGTKNWTFDEDDFSAAIDIETALKNAWEIGRSGTDEERLTEINKAKTQGVDVSASMIQNPEFLYDELLKIKEETDKPMKNATVTMNYDGSAKFIYTNEEYGNSLDVDAAYADITALLQTSSQVEYALAPVKVSPVILRSQLEKNYVRVSIAQTPLSNSQPDRKHNILLALAEFDELSLMPGETMSFNQIVGERTVEKGYRMSVFINTDQVYDETAGGGICQTSTTLYNAALLAGATARGKGGTIEIVERYPHSWPSSYIKEGLDASVNWPYADLRLRNNGTSPIFFHTYYTGSQVTVEIYGEALPNNAKITLKTVERKDLRIPAPALVEVKDTLNKYNLAPGEKKQVSNSRIGQTWETYQIWTEPGKEPVETLINTTVYNAIPGKVYVGVE